VRLKGLLLLKPYFLICLFQDLENSASSDAVVREKIASLPPEVSEIALLSKLEGSVCM
jgi:regulator of Ty1 transposition protein 103